MNFLSTASDMGAGMQSASSGPSFLSLLLI